MRRFTSIFLTLLALASPVVAEEIHCPFKGWGMVAFESPEGFQMIVGSEPESMSIISDGDLLACINDADQAATLPLSGQCTITTNGGEVSHVAGETICMFKEGEQDDCVAVCG